jgi:uncharacterized membrane protein
MTGFKKQITIEKPIAKVWEIVSDLGKIDRFHPGVRKSYYTNSLERGFGAARICELQPSGKILETVKQWKEGEGFLLQIEPIEKAPPVKNFEGDFELKEIGSERTQISVIIKYNMKLGAIGVLLNKLIIQSKMESGIDSLLSGLKLHAEMGVEIKDDKHLNEVYLEYSNNNK